MFDWIDERLNKYIDYMEKIVGIGDNRELKWNRRWIMAAMFGWIVFTLYVIFLLVVSVFRYYTELSYSNCANISLVILLLAVFTIWFILKLILKSKIGDKTTIRGWLAGDGRWFNIFFIV